MFSKRSLCVRTIWLVVFYIASAEQKGCAKNINCTGLKSCKTYMAHIKAQSKPLHPSMVRFLKENQCGFEGGVPKVCCGEIPESLQNKYGVQKIKKNNLSAIRVEVMETKKPPSSTQKLKKIPQDVIVDFPHFYLTDFMEPFDLFRRKRGYVHFQNTVEVEIR